MSLNSRSRKRYDSLTSPTSAGRPRKKRGKPDQRKADPAGLDFYPTPPAITEQLLRYEQFPGKTWEPAAGAGDMAKALEEAGLDVVATELRESPDVYGTGGVNFLESAALADVANIVTNPPFNLAPAFLAKAKASCSNKIAFLLRLNFLESQRRVGLFSDTSFPLARVYVFSYRVTMTPGELPEGKNSGSICFAWFVWDRSFSGPPTIRWLVRDEADDAEVLPPAV